MKHLTALLLLLATTAQAEVTIGGAAVYSDGLGYESFGYGLSLNVSDRYGNWGYDAEGTALSQAKYEAKGRRYETAAMGRYFRGDWFIEAGAEYGGYRSEFEDGRVWTKYGYSLGVGLGKTHNQTEYKLRYFIPDTTPNRTSIIAASIKTPIARDWVAGLSVKTWHFDFRDERRRGYHAMVTVGRRW